MKKIIGICIILVLVFPSVLFAGSVIGVKVGPAVSINQPIYVGEPDPNYFNELGLEDIAYGADIRCNISIAEISSLLLVYPFPYFDTTFIHGTVCAGASLELLGLVDVGITAGTKFEAAIDGSGFNLDENTPGTLEEFPLFMRATADINFGGLSAGVFALLDSGITIGDALAGIFPDPADPDLVMTLGASVLFRLL